jgi:quercetin dioxygenase-like cupin family protein
MRTTVPKSLAVIGAGITLTLAAATGAFATAPSGESVTPLARGQLAAHANVNRQITGGRVRIKTAGSLDALMMQITLQPGGTGGWHMHAGPLITVVTQGTLTIIDAKCQRHVVPMGHAFVSPGSTAKDENLGATPTVFDVTFMIPSSATSPRIDQPAPAGCNA